MQSYDLLPDGDRWRLTGEGSERTLMEFETKKEAVERCSHLMQNQQGSLKIHRADGTFEEERTYPRSEDPVESKG